MVDIHMVDIHMSDIHMGDISMVDIHMVDMHRECEEKSVNVALLYVESVKKTLHNKTMPINQLT